MSTSPRTGHEAGESEADREAAAAAAAAERSASLWGRFNTAKRRYVAAVQGLPLLARVAPGVLPATVPAAAPTKGKVNVTLFSSITRAEMEAITEFRVARSAIASAHRALVRGGEAAPAKVSLEEVLGVPLPPSAARMAYRMANVSAPLMHCMFTAHGFKPSGNGASTFGGEAAPTSGATDWHAMWVSSFLKSYAFQALRPGQVVNQFPRTYEVTRKDTLARNIMRMQELHGDRHFAFLPATYVLPADAAAFNAACARDPDTAWIVKPAASSKGKGIYIARCPEGYTQRDLAPGQTTPPDTPSSTAPTPPPDARRPAVSPLALAAAQAAAAAARSAGEDPSQSGTGSLSEVVNTARASNSGYRVSTATMGGPEFFTAANRRGMKRTPAHQALPSAPGMPPGSPGAAAAPLLGEGVARAVAAAAAEGLQGGVEDNCIVSRYIDEPALVDGFKYDLRVYAAVTSFCPLKVYIHKEGLARFATERYTPDPAQYQNKFVHLTNYSLNKASSKYQAGDGAEGAGHKWTLSALLARLLRDGVDVDAMWGRVEELIVKTLLSIEGNVTAAVNMFVPCPATNCFQLFGFDVMMDAELNPWLLEVNFSPSLATDSDLDLRVKSQVLADTLNLVGMPT
ncbi:TTLL5, partial [Symbiodinium sp. KB8]